MIECIRIDAMSFHFPSEIPKLMKRSTLSRDDDYNNKLIGGKKYHRSFAKALERRVDS